jgi:hypothetical protein
MGHIKHSDLRDMVRKGMVTGIKLNMGSKPEFCEPCTHAKAARKLFPKKSKSEPKSPKLMNPVIEGCFVGYNEETKDGLHIYWPGTRRVTVERDVSYNKNDVTAQETVQIEGGEEPVTPPASTAPPTPETTQDNTATPQRDKVDETLIESKTHLDSEVYFPGIDLNYNAPGISDQLLSRAQHEHYRKAVGRLLYMSRGPS